MAAAAMASSAGPRYAPEDPTLPTPWRGLVDGKTGYLYFWNPETNITQYERPLAPGSAPRANISSVPLHSSVQIHDSSVSQNRECRADDENKYGRCGNSSETGNQQSSGGGTQYPQNAANGMITGESSHRGPASGGGGSGLSAEAYCRQHEITVSGENVPPPFTTFEATGFPPEILRVVKSAGFSAPTPIQAQSWPIAMQSRDIVAVAKTGSGKTLGYLMPGFAHLKRTHKNSLMGPTVLVLSPTRELATQIQDEAVKFGKSSRISCTCLYGGAPKGPQLKELERGADIVVATPGRLNDILESRKISLHQVSYLVLDEADRMLDMGFEPQIRKIVKGVPPRRQTLMYTATWPKEVRRIAADLLVNPVQVNIGNVDELVANKSISQYVEIISGMEKQRRVEQILRSQEPRSKIIIFCSTKKMCDQLAHNLTRNFGAASIHGDKSQGERDYVLGQFRTGKSPVLVATDVAARGLDIKDIRVVINYDFPTGVEDYVHRIGRTGRAGATGVSYTFFGDHDAKYASDLIKLLEGANQQVPPELRDMASCGGGGMGRFRRWGSGSAGSDGGRADSCYGGRGGSDYGGRGGSDYGRGSYGGRSSDYDSRDRGGYSFHDSIQSGEKDKGGWGDNARERSRSPTLGSDQPSFHQSMMARFASSATAKPQSMGEPKKPVEPGRLPRGRSPSGNGGGAGSL